MELHLYTCVDALVLLHMRELLEGLVAELALVLADVGVDERVLRELLRRRERLETVAALVRLLLQPVHVFCMTLQLGLALEFLPTHVYMYMYMHRVPL